ncbi:MAG: hypothetical protein HYY24_14245 [Verrucomicrobia bacterium]|nr:hypothetical protein [Verrucomicrobiota bacterium]
MTDLKNLIRVTLALGVLSLLALLFSHLALTDIAHGEADVELEWNVLRVCALVLLLFIGATLFTLRRVLRATSSTAVGGH